MFTLSPVCSRIPDVAVVGPEKYDQWPDENVPIPFAPDLAVEVISASEPDADTETKVQEYLAAAVQEVWQVYPDRRIVRVRTAAGMRDLGRDEILTSTVMAGFEAPVSNLFSRR